MDLIILDQKDVINLCNQNFAAQLIQHTNDSDFTHQN